MQVTKWNPPKEYTDLKKFMLKQIMDSIDFDCNMKYDEVQIKNIVIQSPLTWKENRLKEYKAKIDYYEKEYKEDVERCKLRNKWVNGLRNSLKEL